MVYLEQESNTQIYGDVQTNRVSFKEENIDFIMSILSSNLYSNPIGSLIREYVSNAEDSHREAGTDDPIIVTLDKNEYDDNFFFSVQDFGVGISPERFEDVFINLASSTKRESNTYIGMWGLGRLSGLSYSSQVNITSIYNGNKTYYLMYKDGNKIFIDSLGSEDTEERNGVTITIPVNREDLSSFGREILKQLSFFEKVHLSINDYGNFDYYADTALSRHKNSKIKYYKTFALNTYYPNSDSNRYFNQQNETVKILVGNVVYPIKFDLINLPKYIKRDENIFIRFSIGELEVTPNREDILYSKKNIDAINKRLLEAEREKLEVFKPLYEKDIEDITAYYNYIGDLNEKITVIKSDNMSYDVDLYFGDKISFRYNGIDYKKKNLKSLFIKTYDIFNDISLFHQNQRINDGKISNSWKWLDNDTILSESKKIVICDFTNLSAKAKRYFRDEVLPYKNYPYTISRTPIISWFRRIIKTFNSYDGDSVTTCRKLLKSFMGYLLEKTNDIAVFDSSCVPNDYDLPKKNVERDFNKENIQFNYITLSKNEPVKTSTHTHSCPVEEINKFTVYASKDDDLKIRSLCHFISKQMRYNSKTRYSDNISFCTVAPGKIKYLQNNSNLIPFEDFMKTDTPFLRGLATIEYINREYPMLYSLCKIENLGVISPDLVNVQQEFKSFMHKYDYYKYYANYSLMQRKLMGEIYELCKENDWWDDDAKNYFDKYSRLIKGAEVLLIFLNCSHYIPDSMVNIIIDYVTTKDLFDVPEEMKEKLKKETVFNIKK